MRRLRRRLGDWRVQAALAALFVCLLSGVIFWAGRDPGPSYTVRTPISELKDAQAREQVSEFEAAVQTGLDGKEAAEAAEQAGSAAASKQQQTNWPGLTGKGWTYGAAPHEVTVSVTSEVPAGTVGYLIPTSIDKYVGKVEAGTAWSLSTTAYGSPDYARVFIQAGARGYPVTCTVVVDGKVTDQRSTVGPWGQSMCQG